MKYDNHLNYRDRKRLLLRLRFIFAVIVLIVAGFATYFYISYIRDNNRNTDESSTSQKTNSVVSSKISIFKSPYFQFQANDGWAEVPTESSQNRFVYRSFRSGLLEQDLTIYVNQIPADLRPTIVFPVDIVKDNDNGARFKPNTVSDHCGKTFTPDQHLKDVNIITLKNVTFACFGDINQYNVIVGKNGGETNVTLLRPDGSTAVYTMYYRDLRAVSGPTDINQIVASFQTR